jgi:endonuclease/exonuclease/phosphatase family metal-dependent hydrolase
MAVRWHTPVTVWRAPPGVARVPGGRLIMNKILFRTLIIGGVLCVLSSCSFFEEDSFVDDIPGQPGQVTVMTRNMYVGAGVDLNDIDPASMFGQFLATDIIARAEALAEEIVAARPDLVGLQEVALARIQVPADRSSPATTVFSDHLSLLLKALERRGAIYDAVGTVDNLDFELSVQTASLGLADLRVTDRDVVLARRGVATMTAAAQNFIAARTASFMVDGQEVTAVTPRGFVTINAVVNGSRVRFTTTHLETIDDPATQAAQVSELLTRLNTFRAADNVPEILVGDFNSDALPATPQGASYDSLLMAGFFDVGPAGFTCCQPTDLISDQAHFDRRIDLVLVREGSSFGVLSTDVVGDDPGDRVSIVPSTGIMLLWPSDHAGVVVGLSVAGK